MSQTLVRFGIALFAFSLCAASVGRAQSDHPSGPPDIVALLAKVPEGASWQDLPGDLRTAFVERANELLRRDRDAWGAKGLARKEETLLGSPTPLMVENMDRTLRVKFAAELPDGFQMARDVSNTDLQRILVRIYLLQTSDRAAMLLAHSDWRGWDGLAVKEVRLLDHEHWRALSEFMADTDARLRKIPDSALTPTERLLRDKALFSTRARKHFARPPVGLSGTIGLSAIYHLDPDIRPFSKDDEWLDAFNASMFSEFRDVNVGSLQSFLLDYEIEFNEDWLKSQGLSATLVASVLKLGNLYRTRVLAHPDHNRPCTTYSAEERAANWDTFTADMLANADGQESMESYATLYAEVANRRSEELKVLAQATVDAIFPAGAPELSAPQRAAVAARIRAETKPAAILETIYAALDESTGGKAASDKVKAAVDRQEMVGGYKVGDPVRPEDEIAILEMWNTVRKFIEAEYRGYPVDIAALVPAKPVITSGATSAANGGTVSIGLNRRWFKASLYSMLLHEIKHAIDQKSHAAVEGAAWEGAATSIERQVWPIFISRAIAGDKVDQMVAQLVTAVDNVRFTAATDATLKTFLRPPGDTKPDSFQYAMQIVAGYGYTDPDTLANRSQRANAGTQYLEYDYGLVMYADLLAYLQAGIGPTPRVDAYLLQACGMPSPKRNQASIDRLKAAIQARRQ